MTAVASPPPLSQHNRPVWGINGGHAGRSLNSMNHEDLNHMFIPRKGLQRKDSSSSISSTSSASSTSTVATTVNSQHSSAGANGVPPSQTGDLSSWPNGGARKRPQAKGPWPSPKPDGQPEFPVPRMSVRPQLMGGLNGSGQMHSPSPVLQSQAQMASQQLMSRPMAESMPAPGQSVLYLLSLNGTFERKNISVPFSPDTLRIGRQTNQKTIPTPVNGFFDSKVLSRQHAEIWADRQGKIWIKDVKSSNGTFVNGTRLSQENRESEPHELQTGDHLELGIDIVSEDQKTVVHHKVAAKVEYAGFLNSSSNLLDLNFGDLDPSNGSMMMGGVPYRGRAGSQASAGGYGRMGQSGAMMGGQPNGMAHQRGGFFFSPISTDQIVKRLQSEMRTARLQSQDLTRTGQFISTLLSKDDVKDLEKPEPAEHSRQQMVNGNGASFMRADNKTRFSDPPAPPPQQPLPEKPDVAPLKRGVTERPKSQPPNSSISPNRQDGNVSQILQLTEALNSAKREIEAQTSRMHDLEEMLHKERQARELAEELARRLEEAASANANRMNGAVVKPEQDGSALEEAFEPPVDSPTSPEVDTPTSDVGTTTGPSPTAEPAVENIEASATQLHSQLESMVTEMRELKQQLETFRQHAETAEADRDVARQTLAEMVLQIRRETDAKEAAAREKSRSRSRARALPQRDESTETPAEPFAVVRKVSTTKTTEESDEAPSLSRANTITPMSGAHSRLAHEQALAQGLPYASMLGVVLIGMGLMAYINGWQTQPPRFDR